MAITDTVAAVTFHGESVKAFVSNRFWCQNLQKEIRIHFCNIVSWYASTTQEPSTLYLSSGILLREQLR